MSPTETILEFASHGHGLRESIRLACPDPLELALAVIDTTPTEDAQAACEYRAELGALAVMLASVLRDLGSIQTVDDETAEHSGNAIVKALEAAFSLGRSVGRVVD